MAIRPRRSPSPTTMRRAWYAGAFASTVRLAAPSGQGAQGIAFVGYAKQWATGVSFEVGADYAAFFRSARL